MSLRATTLVWERANAKGGALLLMLAIADYAKDDGRFAFPSNKKLAEKTRLTVRAIQFVLRQLEADGELVEEQVGKLRYLHLRCVYDWDQLQAERAAKSLQDENFSRGLTPEGSNDSANISRESTSDFRGGMQIPDSSHLSGSVIDPSSEQEHAAPSSPPLLKSVHAVENSINFALLLKFAHEVIDVWTPSIGELEIEHGVEQLCIARRVPWDRDTVWRAVRSALGARRRQGATR